MGTGAPEAAAVHAAPPPRLGAKRAFGIFLAFLAVQLVAGLAIGIAGAVWFVVQRGSASPAVVAEAQRFVVMPAAFVGTVGGGAVVLWLTRLSLPGPLRSGALQPVGWSAASSRSVLVAMLAGVSLAALYLLGLVSLLPPDPSHRWGPVVNVVSAGGWPRHLWALFALGVAPPVEEFLFRGVLFTGLSGSWTRIVAGAVVTALFLAGHVTEVWGYAPAILAVTALGVAALLARVASRSLAPAVALHAAYNLVLVIGAYSAA